MQYMLLIYSNEAAAAEATSARIPASFPPPAITSLGHLRPTAMPRSSLITSTTATPVASGNQPQASVGTFAASTPTESAICVRGAADHCRP